MSAPLNVREAKALREENASLKASCLNQCADNLCWLSDPEVGKALPESEFLESCRRYRNQIAGTVGELTSGTMTIAQLEASNAKLRAQNGENKRYLDAISQALHPHKPEDGWTYLPDQLAAMVEGCVCAMDLGRTQTNDAFYRISNQQDELSKLRADLDVATTLLREADEWVGDDSQTHLEIEKFLKEHA